MLIVDDIAANRAVLRDMLSELNFEVTEAANGQEALRAARLQRPDIILMDIFMPEMDGLEVIRHLRRTPQFSTIPIIAVSASASNSDAATCVAAGANAFVAKPVVEAELLAEIGSLLRLQWTA